MTVQWSTTVRNSQADAWESAMGTSVLVRLRTGAPPANCGAADTGTLIAEFPLASDWSPAATTGAKTLSGLPLEVAALAAGTIGHYRFMNTAGTVCHEQGTVTVTGGGGDMTMDTNVINAVGQTTRITGYTKTWPGA